MARLRNLGKLHGVKLANTLQMFRPGNKVWIGLRTKNTLQPSLYYFMFGREAWCPSEVPEEYKTDWTEGVVVIITWMNGLEYNTTLLCCFFFTLGDNGKSRVFGNEGGGVWGTDKSAVSGWDGKGKRRDKNKEKGWCQSWRCSNISEQRLKAMLHLSRGKLLVWLMIIKSRSECGPNYSIHRTRRDDSSQVKES